MKVNWEKTKYSGVQLYQHNERKHGVKYDCYFRGRYMVSGKNYSMAFGWSSEGWSAKSVFLKLQEFKSNAKRGACPKTIKEEKIVNDAEKSRAEKLIKKKEVENISFSDFFENVYKPVSKTNKKHDSCRKEIEHFKNWLNPEIGHLPIKKIAAFNLEKIKKNMLDAGRAPRTIQYVFATFRQVWNHARINDLINEDSPTRKVKLPKVENQRLKFLDHDQAKALLSELIRKSQQVHDMTLLSLHTGVRAGEIFSLTWGVIDFQNGSALIRDSKGKKRHVYLTVDTQAMLEHMFNGQASSELVFKGNNGNPITKISNTFERTVKELGFNDGVTDRRDKVIFHTCRHTFASWHVQNGTDLYTVKELLGHSTIQLTERYSHLRPDGLKKAAQNFDKKVIQNNIVPIKRQKRDKD